ncbi:unnamed protein product [Didymodactylos carnosus]|uniref:Uncharacterized protein n=1 Tax=Didymodactylos carnosus TaxID=1234261 RepID=A0A814IMA2_9BILA|nr:unnamed protein product [Didymodactylos carnosus]CAF1226949.1 unnamed protein product [Didymodactylos carnosus]CAF3798988.1 unnamed protein product [Didymodactylos carnosus]CAF4035016.1 unnamed protein product [Didymodactylos carnosus]
MIESNSDIRSTLLSRDNDVDSDYELEQTQPPTVEKFIQNRHIQTLKYLKHVIDENRQLKLQVQQLQRQVSQQELENESTQTLNDQLNSVSTQPTRPTSQSTIVDDPVIDSPVVINTSTNDKVVELEKRLIYSEEENVQLKKQYAINRDEFRRELDRVDERNTLLENENQTLKQQLEKQVHLNEKKENEYKEKIIELHIGIDKQRKELDAYDYLKTRTLEMEKNYEQLTNSYQLMKEENERQLKTIEQFNIEHKQMKKLVTIKHEYERLQQSVSDLYLIKNEHIKCEKQFLSYKNEIEMLKRKIDIECDKYQDLFFENSELKEKITKLEHTNNEQTQVNFRDFVNVKRELHACKGENEQLKVDMVRLIKQYNLN